MTADPGPLVGRGRQADVYRIAPGRVVRRYRDPNRDTGYEARFLAYMHAAGVPVPEVFDSAGPDLVMAEVTGPTMLADVGRRPWVLSRHARTLAELHGRVAAVPAQDWMVPALGGGDQVVHVDLHPDNVLMSPDGPVIIDWESAARGTAAAAAAFAWLVMTTAPVIGGRAQRAVTAAGRGTFVRAFRAALAEPFDDQAIATAVRWRWCDRSLLPEERRLMQQRYADVLADLLPGADA